MPELPEVEITARRLDGALRGAAIEPALAPGINALRSFDPPLTELAGRTIAGVRRRGKHLIVEIDGGGGADDAAGGVDLALLIHLMSAGRLQLYDKRAGPRDRTSRLLVRVRLAATVSSDQEADEFEIPFIGCFDLGDAGCRTRCNGDHARPGLVLSVERGVCFRRDLRATFE